jgi:hypothetical protein
VHRRRAAFVRARLAGEHAPEETVMIGIADGTEAWALTKAMARRVGVDLPAAVFEGWLTRPEVTRLVCACERCGLTPLCADWLAVPREPDLPAYCRNKDEIEALA